MGSSILLIVAINLVIGLTIEEIDMAAHLGGLIAGFFASAIVNLSKVKRISFQLIDGIATTILLAVLTIFGITGNLTSQSFQLLMIQDRLEENEYTKVIDMATEPLTLDG